jgi:hypothetical protein
MKNASRLICALLIGIAMLAGTASADTTWSVPAFAGTTVGDQAIYNDTDGAKWEAYRVYGYDGDYNGYFSTDDSINFRSWETDWSNYALMTWKADDSDDWYDNAAWRGDHWKGTPRYGRGGTTGTYDKTMVSYLVQSGGNPSNDTRGAMAFVAPSAGQYDLGGTLYCHDWHGNWDTFYKILKLDSSTSTLTILDSGSLKSETSKDLSVDANLQDILLDAGDRLIITARAAVDKTIYNRAAYDVDKGTSADMPHDVHMNLSEVTVTVPEPATMGLLGAGAIGMLIRRKRK